MTDERVERERSATEDIGTGHEAPCPRIRMDPVHFHLAATLINNLDISFCRFVRDGRGRTSHQRRKRQDEGRNDWSPHDGHGRTSFCVSRVVKNVQMIGIQRIMSRIHSPTATVLYLYNMGKSIRHPSRLRNV